MKPSELIEAALETLSEESRWCQRAYAMKDGRTQGLPDPGEEYDAYCLRGAIIVNLPEGFGTNLYNRTHEFIDAEIGFPPGEWSGAFNDDRHTTFEDVRLVLKRAAERAFEVGE